MVTLSWGASVFLRLLNPSSETLVLTWPRMILQWNTSSHAKNCDWFAQYIKTMYGLFSIIVGKKMHEIPQLCSGCDQGPHSTTYTCTCNSVSCSSNKSDQRWTKSHCKEVFVKRCLGTVLTGHKRLWSYSAQSSRHSWRSGAHSRRPWSQCTRRHTTLCGRWNNNKIIHYSED